MKHKIKTKIVLPAGVEHGTRAGFLRGCSCGDCHAADRVYKRDWNRRKVARVRLPADDVRELAESVIRGLRFTIPELAARIKLSATTMREIVSGRRKYLNPSTHSVAKERLQELCSKLQA